MANILDYLAWRGDIGFDASPLNEVDALILCQLSYLQFDAIVPADFRSRSRSLRELAQVFAHAPDYERRSKLGALINAQTLVLLQKAGESARFGALELSGYRDTIDYEQEEQFCAVCFSWNAVAFRRWHFLAYRGTDDTLVGWKEDFNLGYLESIPSQRDALRYLNDAARHLGGRLFLGGHSKGGNLALYAAVHASGSVRRRIHGIYDNDGPGFSPEFFASESYRSMREKLHTFVPRLSVVGMLFSHPKDYIIVESGQKDMLMQHDPFSWQILGRAFTVCGQTGRRSQFVDRTVNAWFNDLSKEEKALFVETVFSIIEGTEARTNTELSANWLDSALKMVRATQRLNAKTRDAVIKTMQLLFKIMMDDLLSEQEPPS